MQGSQHGQGRVERATAPPTSDLTEAENLQSFCCVVLLWKVERGEQS